jgi:hypothetical protein
MNLTNYGGLQILLFLITLLALAYGNNRMLQSREHNRNTFYNEDEQLDENGIIQADFNIYPSRFQTQALLVRLIYFDSIDKIDTSVIKPENSLLIGIPSPATDFQRRHLMRAHQIKPFSHYNVTWRFFVGQPPIVYREFLKLENDTYGDIIFLEDFHEDRKNARAVKTFEFFDYVEKHMGMYKYVAKIDTDAFLNVKDFINDYFNETIQEMQYSMIAVQLIRRFQWPQGGFLALSWKLMLLLNRFYNYVHRSHYAEDMQFGWYLYDAAVEYDFIGLDKETSFDFKVPWGKNDVPYNALRVHEMKTEQDYLIIANCFNGNGINTTHVDLMRKNNWTVLYNQT